MENVAEALKMAFGIVMFILALSLSISSFSNAREAIDSIITIKDRETSYTYVEKYAANNKIVGVETIVPTMYKAYNENFQIRFYEKYNSENDCEKLALYTYHDPNGNTEEISIIDLSQEHLGSTQNAIQHLDNLLSGTTDSSMSDIKGVKLYDYLKDKKFIEKIGEYYEEDLEGVSDVDDTNKTKKRVITYILYQ